MIRPRMILGAALASCSAVVLGLTQPAFAQFVPDVGGEEAAAAQSGTSKLFKLHLTRTDYPEIMRDYKRPPKVDAGLVRQIDQVRIAVPSWHGIHHLMPGASGSGI